MAERKDGQPKQQRVDKGFKLPPVLRKKPAKKAAKKTTASKRRIKNPGGRPRVIKDMSVDPRYQVKLDEAERPPSTKAIRKTIAKRTGVPTRRVKNKHDWPKIRAWFMEADIDTTLKDCAEYFDLSYSMLGVRAGRERWIATRVEYKAEQARKHYAKRTKKLQDGGEKFDDSTIRVADMGMNLVQARMGEIAQLYQATSAAWQDALDRKQRGLAVEKEELWSSIRSSELLDLARALQLFQEIGRKAYGTDILMAQLQISGPDGGAIEVNETINVAGELGKEDPARLAKFMEVMERTGLLQGSGLAISDTIEGEVVDDDGNPVEGTDDAYTETAADSTDAPVPDQSVEPTTMDGDATEDARQPTDQEGDDSAPYVKHTGKRSRVWTRDPEENTTNYKQAPGQYVLEN